jgi:hypothetical protein
MARESFATRAHGLIAYWPFLLEQARAFNRAPERQTCSACGHGHPPCYGFDAKLDQPDEAAARAEY